MKDGNAVRYKTGLSKTNILKICPNLIDLFPLNINLFFFNVSSLHATSCKLGYLMIYLVVQSICSISSDKPISSWAQSPSELLINVPLLGKLRGFHRLADWYCLSSGNIQLMVFLSGQLHFFYAYVITILNCSSFIYDSYSNRL